MLHIRTETEKEVNRFIVGNSLICDPLDLKFQVLFRSTTYKPEELFSNGGQLNRYLKASGVFEDWRKILHLSQKQLQSFKMDGKKLSAMIEEQYKVIDDRLSRSSLPFRDLFRMGEIFKEPGWRIKRAMGLIYASNKTPVKERSLPLEFHEVELNYARSVFQDLHYIHTPRADTAIGIFLSGERLPFSVIGATRIDRDYKKDILLIQGYDPDKCWDIARLYNIPGSPMNTSSIMMSQVVRYLKIKHPDTQACMTAITPSFSTGRSMVAGGFMDPALARPLAVTFGQMGVGPDLCWERLTERRLESYSGPKITNRIPLLPILGLIRHVSPSESEPLVKADRMVISNI